ncbi:MAG: CRTAC1 family protein [Verrucomicrobiales bacterium]|nr:CRTAC1 family protein [Verrucomicrobiales bacterium]
MRTLIFFVMDLRKLVGALSVLAIALLSGCDDKAGWTDESDPDVERSHQRMLIELEEIRRRTPDENPFMGDAATRELRMRLANFGGLMTADDKFDAHMRLGIGELNLGNEREAIANLEAAIEMGDEAGIQISEKYEALYFLSIAWLRLGETANCCRSPSPESCIVPLQGDALHSDPEGSENALKYLEQMLEIGLDAGRLSETAWLMNVATMTLGNPPESLPENVRIQWPAVGSPGSFPRFRNIAADLGIDTFNLSGGAIADDFNGDGLIDIVTSSFDTGSELRFWKNTGTGTFLDRSKEAGFSGLFGGLNLLQADYDNDGDLDLLVLRGAYFSRAGQHPNSLLRNDGTGVFTDVTYATGLGVRNFPTQTAGWADFDLDGDLDLYVGNESEVEFRIPGQLFRNDGRQGKFVRFVEISAEAGVENFRFAKGVSWGDFNSDRYPDLYISNQGEANRLYRNNGDGTFTDVASQTGVEGPANSFPVWFWDFNNDGAEDLFVSDYNGRPSVRFRYLRGEKLGDGEICGLYAGDGKGNFQNRSRSAGLDVPMLPMGSNFGDIDNDGFPDFYLGTGTPEFSAITPNLFFLNQGGQKFQDVTWESGFGHLQKGHAVAFADFDQDGDLDVFEQMGGAFPGDKYYDALFENPGFGGSHWISVRLDGVESNRFGVGCRLRAVIEEGGVERSVYSHVNSGGSFGGNPLTQHLGLGSAKVVKRLEIFWPATGVTQVFKNVEAGRKIRIKEGSQRIRSEKLRPFRFQSAD